MKNWQSGQTAQVAIVKDLNPLDTDVSVKTQKTKKPPTPREHTHVSQQFNADLMRSLITRKMNKNKTFYEAKMLNYVSKPAVTAGHYTNTPQMGSNTARRETAPSSMNKLLGLSGVSPKNGKRAGPRSP